MVENLPEQWEEFHNSTMAMIFGHSTSYVPDAVHDTLPAFDQNMPIGTMAKWNDMSVIVRVGEGTWKFFLREIKDVEVG